MKNKLRIDSMLTESFADFRLDSDEKAELRELLDTIDDEAVRYLRNTAFAMARNVVVENSEASIKAISWLERVAKAVDLRLSGQLIIESVHFSPGEACRRAIVDLLQQAKRRVDICVFTISDNVLSEKIIAAHQRGVSVRIITDNDKVHDMGSDVHQLADSGIAVRVDRSSNHMHHKYAIIDHSLINGSFNWTRSATERNQENIVVSSSRALLLEFQTCFDMLWQRFES